MQRRPKRGPNPRRLVQSLTPTGIPLQRPQQFSFRQRFIAAAACAINDSSATSVTIAFTLELTRPICFKCARHHFASRQFISRINFAMSTARIKQMSLDESEVFAAVGDVA